RTARRRGPRRDEPGHAREVRGRVLQFLRRRNPGRVAGAANCGGRYRTATADVPAMGKGARRCVPLTLSRSKRPRPTGAPGGAEAPDPALRRALTIDRSGAPGVPGPR